MLLRVLLCIRSHGLRELLGARLGRSTLVELTSEKAELWSAIRAETPDLVILSTAALGDELHGFLQALLAVPDGPQVVLITDSDPSEHTAYLASGCLAVLDDDDSSADLAGALEAIVARLTAERVTRVVARARVDRKLDAMGTSSPAIRHFLDATRRVAAGDSPVLIQGEPGSGKTWLGPVVHGESPRASGPFHSLRCSDLPKDALESALFGHAADVLPGARAAGRGAIERAHLGTLFLERIDDAPMAVQVKLLRYLDLGKWRRVGGRHWIHVDVRLLASVQDEPEAHVEAGTLHPELYRRIGLVGLRPPPLRDRPEDVPELAVTAHQKWRARYGLAVGGFTPSAMDVLMRHTWPGNVSELLSVVERSTLLSRGDQITIEDLPFDMVAHLKARPSDGFVVLDAPWLHDPAQLPTLREIRTQALEVVERVYLGELLRAAGGRVAEAARRAEVDPRSLYERMRRYGLRKEDFKPPRRPRRRRSGDS